MSESGEHDATRPAQPAQPTQPAAGAPEKSGRGISVRQIISAILLILVVIFIFENQQTVRIRIIAGPKQSVPLSVALVISAVAGALIAVLLLLRRQRRKRRET